MILHASNHPIRSSSDRYRAIWRVLKVLGISTLLLFLISCISAVLLQHGHSMKAIHYEISNARKYFIGIHFVLIALLWWQWSIVINVLRRITDLQESTYKVVLTSRHRIIALLLAVEIFVVIGFPINLWR